MALNAYLRRNHADICRHWFADIDPSGIEGGVLKLTVHDLIQLRYLQRSCVFQFTEAAQSVTGRLLAIRFVGTDEAMAPPVPNVPAEPTSAPPLTMSTVEQTLLSPDFTFDSFVVGPCNRLAHAAAQAVADRPGRAYNPFFVHGAVGLGKTHLLQSICQRLYRQRPSAVLCYVSCATFSDHFHDAVRAGSVNEFRNRFRGVDVLVVDDIHFLSKRDQSQEEFFHTFNALHQAGKQLILSSDAAPVDIPDLESRLVSRFNSGLVVRMERPCFETRVNIVHAKAALHETVLSDELASFIAARVDGNVRELEGALMKIRLLASTVVTGVTMDLVKQALSDRAGSVERDGSSSLQDIVDCVVQYFDVRLADLLGKRRHKSIALPRQVSMYLARRHTRFSLEEIGGYFGGRDHSTVLHAIRTVESRVATDDQLARSVQSIERALGREQPPAPALSVAV
ncbi:MAG: chromosomal replication initiator protein DnaA [Planctomycetota bacterium]|nr:chromosomal replication initiator protein DnaA [Planctomycetota bacterium]